MGEEAIISVGITATGYGLQDRDPEYPTASMAIRFLFSSASTPTVAPFNTTKAQQKLRMKGATSSLPHTFPWRRA
jgi:hypothetical protein